MWDKARDLKEEGYHALAAEEFLAQLPRRPNDPIIHREIGECLYLSQSLGRRGKEDVRRLALAHFLQAIDHHVHRGEKAEAVDLYAKIRVLYVKEIPPSLVERMTTLSGKGFGTAVILPQDMEKKRVHLEEKLKERMNEGDHVQAYAALTELVGMDAVGKMGPLGLILGAEAASRSKDAGLAERMFEQVALRGDERQSLRALLYLGRAWLKTPRQSRLADLYRISRERHTNIDMNPEWVELGEKLRS